MAMCRRALEHGTNTMVATPHIREDYPFTLDQMRDRLAEVSEALRAARMPLQVVPGGEVAVTRAMELDVDALLAVTLGDGPYLLVESPYGYVTEMLERTIFDLQVRGFRPVLAHPERSPCFLGEPDRVAELVERGVLCSVTASSLAGRFGSSVKRFTHWMLEQHLAHNVASDAHDADARPPLDEAELRRCGRELPALQRQLVWLTTDVPTAILRGDELPPRPTARAARGRLSAWLRRL